MMTSDIFCIWAPKSDSMHLHKSINTKYLIIPYLNGYINLFEDYGYKTEIKTYPNTPKYVSFWKSVKLQDNMSGCCAPWRGTPIYMYFLYSSNIDSSNIKSRCGEFGNVALKHFLVNQKHLSLQSVTTVFLFSGAHYIESTFRIFSEINGELMIPLFPPLCGEGGFGILFLIAQPLETDWSSKNTPSPLLPGLTMEALIFLIGFYAARGPAGIRSGLIILNKAKPLGLSVCSFQCLAKSPSAPRPHQNNLKHYIFLMKRVGFSFWAWECMKTCLFKQISWGSQSENMPGLSGTFYITRTTSIHEAPFKVCVVKSWSTFYRLSTVFLLLI